MYLSDFSYDLPEELIAQYPLSPRDSSRLMVLNRHTQRIEQGKFFSIIDYFNKGDLLILNDTKVIPCRLFGEKKTGGKLEIFFLHPVEKDLWSVLIRGKIGLNKSISLAEGNLFGEVIKKGNKGQCLVAFRGDEPVVTILEKFGQVPLPPYIKHFKSPTHDDKFRYQTVFAQKKGAIAAPTAGLHFTRSLLKKIQEKGADIYYLTLHVGLGTFQPVKSNVITDHKMEKEYYSLPPTLLQKIQKMKKEEGARIIACGTTTTRVLESFGQNPDLPEKGWTNLFIYPGFPFKIVDALITNFHLPKSTLHMLVSAFAGKDFIFSA